MDEDLAKQIEVSIIALCLARGPEKSICPSDVARAVVGDDGDWRALMDTVRQVAADLAHAGRIRVTQKGQTVSAKGAKGPLRLRLASGDPV